MTRTVLLAGQGQAQTPSRSKRSAPASSLFRKTLDAMQFLMFGSSAAAVAKAGQPYPWLPATIRGNMSPRAQRLMRSGD